MANIGRRTIVAYVRLLKHSDDHDPEREIAEAQLSLEHMMGCFGRVRAYVHYKTTESGQPSPTRKCCSSFGSSSSLSRQQLAPLLSSPLQFQMSTELNNGLQQSPNRRQHDTPQFELQSCVTEMGSTRRLLRGNGKKSGNATSTAEMTNKRQPPEQRLAMEITRISGQNAVRYLRQQEEVT
jgi:hypothetical protein